MPVVSIVLFVFALLELLSDSSSTGVWRQLSPSAEENAKLISITCDRFQRSLLKANRVDISLKAPTAALQQAQFESRADIPGAR